MQRVQDIATAFILISLCGMPAITILAYILHIPKVWLILAAAWSILFAIIATLSVIMILRDAANRINLKGLQGQNNKR